MLMSFLLPVLMIGFSSVKKVQYNELIIELQHKTQRLEEKPGDQQLKAEVEQIVATVTARPNEYSADALVTVARAQNALGNDAQALTTVTKALEVTPQLAEAAQLKTAIVEQQNLKQDATELEKKTEQLEKNPNDPNLKREVTDKISKVAARPTRNPEVLVRLARAQKAVGQEEQAISTAKKAVNIDPTSATRIAPMLRVDPDSLKGADRRTVTSVPSPTATSKPR
jgi:tetratricopeptide (TPR) repeat protein